MIGMTDKRIYLHIHTFSGDFMVWSDVERNKIYRMNLHGTGLATEILTTEIAAVGMLLMPYKV